MAETRGRPRFEDGRDSDVGKKAKEVAAYRAAAPADRMEIGVEQDAFATADSRAAPPGFAARERAAVEIAAGPFRLAARAEISPAGLLAIGGESASLVSAGLPSPDVTAVAPARCGGFWVGYRGGALRVRLGAGEDA